MSENALMILETTKPQELFVMNGLDAFIKKIKEEVAEAPKDMSTKKGREEIASLAYKVAKSKTALEKLGKESIEDLQKTVKAVTAERIRGVAALQEIQDNIRKPLTEWENAEKERIAKFEGLLANWKMNADICRSMAHVIDIDKFQFYFDEMEVNKNIDWQEFKARADSEFEINSQIIRDALKNRNTYDADQADLKRLREEAAIREQKERDDKIAAKAAEDARLEAELKAKEEADKIEAARLEAERLAKIESARVEREKQLAIEQAAKAESDKLAAIELAKERAAKADADRIAAEKKVEQDKIIAAAKAEKEKQAAIEAEKKRQADEAAKIAAETAKREADTKHRAKINNEILSAFVGAGITEDAAKLCITAIAKNTIPHIKINY